MNVFLILFLFIFSCVSFAGDFVSISAVGDIMMGTNYPFPALPENQGKDLFSPAEAWIQSAHIRFGNLEGTLFDGQAQPDGKAPGANRWLFRTPASLAPVLKTAGFNVLSLSNNHVNDFGQAGMRSTKKILQSLGIQYSSKSGEVAYFKVQQTKVALIALDYFKAPRSVTQTDGAWDEIRELKSKNDIVIISAHVGGEGNGAEYIRSGDEIFLGENRGNSIAFAQEAIDQGADVILMHGPHVPRGIELYRNRLIVYSLGNFMTGKGISLDGNSKVAPLVRIEISDNGAFRSGQIVPFIQKRGPQRLELDPQRTAIRLIKKLSSEQFPKSNLVIQDNGLFN